MKKLLLLNVVLMFLISGCTQSIAPNAVDAYKIVIDKLYNEDEGLNSDIKYLAIDTTTMVNLNDDAKVELLKALEDYGLIVLDMTFEELEKQGYIEDLYFKEGILFKIEDEPMKNNTIKMNVSKWRSGLGAIGYNNLVMKYKNGEWEITKIGEAWIS
jgi:Ca-activated chloride channel family protein